MRTKIQSWLTVLLSVTASTFICESVQSYDPRLKPWDGNQRPSDRKPDHNNSRPSDRSPQDLREEAAKAQNDQGRDAYDKKDWATAEAAFKKCLEYFPNNPVYLRNLALAQTREGLDAYNNEGDYTTALNYFRQALANDPPTDTFHQKIREYLATAQGKVDAIQQNKTAADDIQRSIQDLAQALDTARSSGGLEFGDPMVVDGRNMPGLPKAVDDSITKVFHDASPDAVKRVRKGFQAVMTRDWNVANAYFEDALNHDPGNPEVIHLVKTFHEAMQDPNWRNQAKENRKTSNDLLNDLLNSHPRH